MVPGLSQPMFLKASLRAKVPWGETTRIVVTKNPLIPLTLFPGIGLPLICAEWKLKFHLVDQSRTIALVRNQKDDALEFGPDVSPLEGGVQ